MATSSSKIEIKATPDKVWKALTQPDLVKQWQYGSDLITDWKVGNKISFKNEWNNEVFEQYGTIIAFNPIKNLKYSLFFPRPNVADIPENYFEMEYIVTEKGDKTIVEIIKRDNSLEIENKDESQENPILTGLKTVVESL